VALCVGFGLGLAVLDVGPDTFGDRGNLVKRRVLGTLLTEHDTPMRDLREPAPEMEEDTALLLQNDTFATSMS